MLRVIHAPKLSQKNALPYILFQQLQDFNNNMPTILLKNQHLKLPKGNRQSVQSQRDQHFFLHIDQKRTNHCAYKIATAQKEAYHLRLPCIYHTENLLKSKKHREKMSAEQKDAKQKQKWTVRRQTREKSGGVMKKGKENNQSRIHTEQRQNQPGGSGNRIYHNFINKKKDKKASHMWKIIEKVVSQDIEPWDIEKSEKKKNRPNQKYSAFEGKAHNAIQMLWEKQALGDYNQRIEPF